MKYTTPSIYRTFPSPKNTSSSHLPLPSHRPPPSESTIMSSDRLMKWLYGYNTTTLSADSNNFGNHAPGIIKSMQILEAI